VGAPYCCCGCWGRYCGFMFNPHRNLKNCSLSTNATTETATNNIFQARMKFCFLLDLKRTARFNLFLICSHCSYCKIWYKTLCGV
jgi:hypothetical protein